MNGLSSGKCEGGVIMELDRDVIKPLIRADLKRLGYTSSQVGVTNQVGANCWGIYVTIKSRLVHEKLVRDVIDKYEVDAERGVCGDPYLGTGLLILLRKRFK